MYKTRNTVRAILLTPDNEVLLMQMDFPWQTELVWILPGGGIEVGETTHAALTREVYEETGAQKIQVVGEAWRQDFFVRKNKLRLYQRMYLVHTPRFDPTPTDLSQLEMEWVRAYRWWSLSDLLGSSALFEPAEIGVELARLIDVGLDKQPVCLEPQETLN